ncbi:MAG: hemerythrin domain-containing protein [Fuerstiella sp.]
MHKNQLEKEFIADHSSTSRGLKALKDALTSNGDAVLEAARELDRIAGPHIAFEEQWLYPLVAKSRGHEFQHHMTSEHDEVVKALAEIKACDDLATVSAASKAEWQRHLQTGLDHVVTCGTLLSHLSTLDETERAEMLQRLQDLRDVGILWTELAAKKV